MLFSSWIFIAVFLPIVWAVYAALEARAGRRLALLWVTAASLVFYGWFKPAYVFIILISLTANFIVGSALARRRSRPLLAAGIVVNLIVLVYYKYTGFFLETWNALGGNVHVPDILLPLGISFFTFQQITYLVDAYKGEAKELDFRNYSLFVIFFPHMIAGPIVHHKEIIPQFEKKTENIAVMGITVFIIGLFKKVGIADMMGEVADPIFNASALGQPLTMIEAWLGAITYSFQIYFDFSGYSDMAVGLAALFGVRMPVNFLSPYKATSITDFWRRWHITLSRLLREYLYIPLGGNRRGPARRYANLMITMIIGGIWHGANWTFAVWGLLHGLYLIINHAWKAYSRWRLPHAVAVAVTFLAVMVAWVFFRAENVTVATRFLQEMAGLHGYFPADGFITRTLRINERWYMLAAAALLAFLAPSTHELMKKKLALDIAKNVDAVKGFSLTWSPTRRWAVGIGLLAALSLMLMTHVNAFIYFQF